MIDVNDLPSIKRIIINSTFESINNYNLNYFFIDKISKKDNLTMSAYIRIKKIIKYSIIIELTTVILSSSNLIIFCIIYD